MPKVVVYVRAEDARVIEATEGREIDKWVRTIVKEQISKWHGTRARQLGAQPLPRQWMRQQEKLDEGA